MNDDVVKDIIQWQRIGCIVVRLSERLNISPEEAFDVFYESDTCRRFHDRSFHVRISLTCPQEPIIHKLQKVLISLPTPMKTRM